jgi:hypothetical protein
MQAFNLSSYRGTVDYLEMSSVLSKQSDFSERGADDTPATAAGVSEPGVTAQVATIWTKIQNDFHVQI